MNSLSEGFQEALRMCLENGMQAPLIIAVVAVNGSVMAGRYIWNESHEGFDYVELAEHIEGEGFAVPINMMIVDSGGEAARVLIGREGIEYLH